MHKEALAQYGHDVLRFLDPSSIHDVFFGSANIVSNEVIADILAHTAEDVREAAFAELPLPRRLVVFEKLEEGRDVSKEQSLKLLLGLLEKHRVYMELPKSTPGELPAPQFRAKPLSIGNPDIDIFDSPLDKLVEFWTGMADRVWRYGFASLDAYYMPFFDEAAPTVSVDPLTQGILFMALSDFSDEDFRQGAAGQFQEFLAERNAGHKAMAHTARIMARGLGEKHFIRNVGGALELDAKTAATLMNKDDDSSAATTQDTPRKELFADLAMLYQTANQGSLLDLHPKLDEVGSPFMKKSLKLVIDGWEPDIIDEWLKLKLKQITMSDKSRADLLVTASSCLRRGMRPGIIADFVADL